MYIYSLKCCEKNYVYKLNQSAVKKTKLYAILESFDKYEQNRLRKYLASPFFNRDQTLVELFEVLIRNVNKPSLNGAMEKEKIWRKLKLKNHL